MKVFVWENVTFPGNYHSGGGLVAVADSIEAVHKLIASEDINVQVDDHPDAVFDVNGEVKEAIYTFPDAGCC